MSPILRKLKYSWFAVLCAVGIFAIVACNLYMLCCGQCVVNDFLRVPLMGWVIIAANVVAGVVLIVVKKRKSVQKREGVCSACEVALRDAWCYCPNCGQAL